MRLKHIVAIIALACFGCYAMYQDQSEIAAACATAIATWGFVNGYEASKKA